MIKPGNFSVNVAADSRRFEFDAHNETILHVKPPVRCVFLGDSITQNFAVNAYFYGTKGAMLNRGIGGDIPYYMLKRFDADVTQLSPEWVVILAGINNIWVLDPNEKTGPRSADYLTQFIADGVIALAKHAKEVGIRCVITSILPTHIPNESPDNPTLAARNEVVCRANKLIYEYCKENDIIYSDAHSIMTQEDGRTLRPELADDGVHPNGLGYDHFIRALRTAAPEIFE